MTKKVVLSLGVHGEKEKKKAMKAVTSLTGIESLAMDMKDKKLTVVGDVDPIEIVGKLRKFCHTQLLTVGPAKVPEKKKEEPKKVEAKKEEPKKTEAEKIEELLKLYENHYPYYTQNYRVYSAEENPNSFGETVEIGNFDPKVATFWIDSGKLKGVFLESGSPEEFQLLPKLARSQPSVDIAKLQKASSVEEALEIAQSSLQAEVKV